MNSHELAVTEINGRGGIRRKDRCAAARPVVMIGCNDSNFNPDGTAWVAPASDGGTALNPQQRAIDHIAGELDVQVLVGATTSGSALALNNYLQPKYKRLFITSSATSPDLEKPATFNASPDGTRLFWRTTANAKGQTSAMKTVLPQLADKVRQKYSTQTVKVAVLAKNDSFGQGTADALESGLQINGAPAGGANVNANYIRLNYREIPGKGAANQVEQSDALASLVAFVPDIIITIGTEEIVAGTATVPGDARNTGFLKPYEDAVRASGARKPFYIHSQANLTATFQAYVDLVSNFGDLAGRKDYLERTRGTNISEPTALARSFFSRFSSSYQTPTSLLFGMAEAYDAVYVSAYLHAATDTEAAPTALQLARAFPALVEGATSVDVGPGTFTSANQLLISGQKVNYNGAAGPLDWDYTNGEAPFDVNVWCVQINGQTGKSFFQQSAGQVWRYGTGNLEGAYNCPQD
jgi:branched-chain amino acid transport system substrate-binding protein